MKKSLLSMAVLAAFGSSAVLAAQVDGNVTNGYRFADQADALSINGSIQYGDVAIDAKDVVITTKDRGGAWANTGIHSSYAGGDILIKAVNDVTIDSDYNAIRVHERNKTSEVCDLKITAGNKIALISKSWAIANEGMTNIILDAKVIDIKALNGVSNNSKTDTITIAATDSVSIESTNVYSIAALGGGAVTIESDNDISIKGKPIVSKNGDITINGQGDTIVEADVQTRSGGDGNIDIDFNTEGSSFTGSVTTEGSGTTDLSLQNGATWNVTGDSTVSSIDAGGAVINVPQDATVAVGDLAGNATVNLETDGTAAGSLEVANGADATLNVSLAGVTADDVDADKAAALIAQVKGAGTVTGAVEEGMYGGAITVGADGKAVAANNSIMSNVIDMASGSTLSMNRMLMNDVRKRLGNIRSAEGTHGVWARYDGGRLSGAMGLENDFHTLQFGIDTVPAADAPRFGVAFSYTKSDADMKRGGAEMDAFGLAAYATKMYDNGAFVDVVGRIATADTDIVVDGDKKGSMDNLAVSLSAEAGWRFAMTERHYVEPQIEVTYTRINNSDLALSNGSAYGIDNVDSVIGRAGFAAGFTCPNKMGDVYVRASVVREFMGDATVRGGKFAHKLDGGDTWFEYGIGANFNLNKNTYVYADVERTSGGALDEDWRANIGVRYSF